MIHILEQNSKDFPDRWAVTGPEGDLTYPALFHAASRWAAYLKTQGPTQSQIIALDQLTPLETVMALWACSLSEAIAFPLNQRFPDLERATILDRINPTLTIGRMNLAGYRHIHPEILNSYEAGDEVQSYSQDEAAPVSLLMTSGSSGAPKFVLHSWANHWASAEGSRTNIPFEPGDRWGLELPLYHAGGLAILYRAAFAGATVVIPDQEKSLLHRLADERISHVSLVATQFQRLLDEMDNTGKRPDLKALLLGGSAIPGDLVQRGLAHDLPIHLSYGSTEMASQVTTTTKLTAADESPIGSGTLLPHRDLLISHEGEILLGGDTLGIGYLDAGQINDFRDEDGWFHSGDVGYLDHRGELRVTGRLDNQFISGGENIQPEHIEKVMMSLAEISQAIVVPIPDKEFGQRPIAGLVIQGKDLTADTLKSELQRSLPGYMIPVAFYLLDGKELNKGLKVDRKHIERYLNDPNNRLHSLS